MSDSRTRRAVILSRIWDDPDWVARSPQAQWVYLMVLSQASLNRAGVIALTLKRWSKLASGTSVETVLAGLEEMEKHRFLIVDHDTEEVWVRSYIRNDGVWKQPNVLKAALRQALEVHSPRIREGMVVELRQLGSDAAGVVASTLSKGSRNPSLNPSGNPSGRVPSAERANGSDNRRSEAVSEPFDEGFGEPFREPFGEPLANPRGEGTLSSNSSSKTFLSEVAPRPDVEELCTLLQARIQANGAKATVTKKWTDDARLLLDRDQRDLAEARKLIEWCTQDAFWKTNILSMPKFRAKYDQLRLRAEQDPNWKQASRANDPTGFQLPAAPREILDDPDPGAYVRWAREQRDSWLQSRNSQGAA